MKSCQAELCHPEHLSQTVWYMKESLHLQVPCEGHMSYWSWQASRNLENLHWWHGLLETKEADSHLANEISFIDLYSSFVMFGPPKLKNNDTYAVKLLEMNNHENTGRFQVPLPRIWNTILKSNIRNKCSMCSFFCKRLKKGCNACLRSLHFPVNFKGILVWNDFGFHSLGRLGITSVVREALVPP